MSEVAFLGLGAMGSLMAPRILRAGHRLAVWNRSPEKARSLVEEGARLAATPRQAAEGAEFVGTMLRDPEALMAVAEGGDGLLAGLRAGAVWLDFSTVAPETSRRCAALAAGRGAAFCDVPVAGSVIPARDGTLTILAGGDAVALERSQPVLAAVGKATVHFGPAGAGSAMKLANNFLVAGALTAFGEALGLAGQLGIDPARAADWLLQGVAVAPYVKTKLDYLRQSGGRPAHFALELMEKDLRLAVEAATDTGALPVVVASRDDYRRAMDAGLGGADFSAVIAHLAGRVP